MNKEKIKKLLESLSTAEDKNSGTFASIEKEMAALSSRIKEAVNIKTVDQVTVEFRKLLRQLDPVKKAIDDLKLGLTEKEKELKTELASTISQLEQLVADSKKQVLSATLDFSKARNNELLDEIDILDRELKSVSKSQKNDVSFLNRLVSDIQEKLDTTIKQLEVVSSKKPKAWDKEISDLKELIDKSRLEITKRINNLPRGGGNANRNIAIGGNTSVLSQYTDINIKPGSNVSLTYTNNQTTKYLDLTITATGGSSSVGGTVRSINNISTSQTAGSTSGTDYVYIASAGVAVTLPTAVGNTNLYTVKNTSNSSVVVLPDGAETIDTSSNAILSFKYTAVDLISDGSNWNIT